jgi:hypothetical protein
VADVLAGGALGTGLPEPPPPRPTGRARVHAPNGSQVTASLLFPENSQARIAERVLPKLMSRAKTAVGQPAHQPGAAETLFSGLLGEPEFALGNTRLEREGKTIEIRLVRRAYRDRGQGYAGYAPDLNPDELV